jgi:DEAD/DEAH box helicase domain-containing protein
VATNALELGLDIGQLDAVVMAGYPGTIASTWQQAGRAGRRATASAAVLIASGAPLDQYLATHPRYLFERSPEHALINPDNLALLADHVRCALFELPFAPGEAFGSLTDVSTLLEVLVEDGEAHPDQGGYRWVGSAYPAEAVSLRAAGQDRVLIQEQADDGRPRVIGEVDRVTAPIRVHAGAIYLHEGRQYQIEKLDWDAGLAHARPTAVDYFTEASEAVEVAIVQVNDAVEAMDEGRSTIVDRPSSIISTAWGELLITAQAASYRMVKRYTHETLGYAEIDLPAREFQTTGAWLWFPEGLVKALAREGIQLGPNNYGPNWEAQRNATRARDGFRCRMCGTPEASGQRQHDVHHIQPFRSFGYVPGANDHYRLANALENLLTLCPACHQRVESGRGTQTALGGFAHALGNVAPLFLMCDPRDLGLLAENRSSETGAPTVTLYDRVPEGLGLAEQIFASCQALIGAARDLIASCRCRDGCPACVGPVSIDELHVKALALRLAERIA